MPLERHRLLGEQGTAALLAPDATVDWWCTPRPDSPPVLWCVLDERGGASRWLGAVPRSTLGNPAGPTARTLVDVEGRTIACWDGLLRVHGEPTLMRMVRATAEPTAVTHELVAASFDPDEGLGDHLLRVADTDGTSREAGAGRVHTTLTAVTHEWRGLAIRRRDAAPLDLPATDLVARLEDAEARMAGRLGVCAVVAAYRDRVETSLLVLDACTEPSTGGVIAAPTTSIPEVLGADRQFDYRYAWVRDASLATSVASLLGQTEVTRAHLRWLLDRCVACEGIPVPVTDVHGDPVPPERELRRIAGIADSRPVRVGNAAKDQVQLDGAGFVAEAVWMLTTRGGVLHPPAYRAVAELADHASGLPQPMATGGIWEQRQPADLTSGDIGLWLLFDRALRLRRLYAPWDLRRRRRWKEGRDRARTRVLEGRLPDGTVPVETAGDQTDGTGLLLVVLHLLDRRDPSAARLVDGTIAALGLGEPVVALRRYPADVDAGFEGEEPAFLPVSWWAVSALAVLDRVDEAHAMADRLCGATPGLQPEMLDVEADQGLGNTPLVWTHAEAARALYLLRLADLRHRWGAQAAGAWEAGRALRQSVRSFAAVSGRTLRAQKSRKPL